MERKGLKRGVIFLAIWMLLAATSAFAAPNIEMVRVSGGCFQMGYGVDHLKLHQVCVDDFSIGKYEVTQAQYQAVTGSILQKYLFGG